MSRYINSADALNTLKHLAYETSLNQHDPYVADVFEDIAKNRLETWVDLIPTADVVEKERYDRLLENSTIIAAALSKYQSADMVEVVRCRDCKYSEDCCRTIRSEGRRPDDFCSMGKRKEAKNG